MIDRARRSRAARAILAVLGVASLVAAVAGGTELWRFRHYYTNLGEADRVIAFGNTIVTSLEAERARDGLYPAALPAVAPGSPVEWTYARTRGGESFELRASLNHWVSSFDAVVYTPDGQYASHWTSLRDKHRAGWLYVCGASDVRHVTW